MHADESLIRRYDHFTAAKVKKLRGEKRTVLVDRYHEQVTFYRNACDLTRGPDAKRVNYWTEKARRIERQWENEMHENDFGFNRIAVARPAEEK